MLREKRDLGLKLLQVCREQNIRGKRSIPLIHPKTFEDAFCDIYGVENIATQNKRLDAVGNGWGFGAKTFMVGSNRSKKKSEKIFENGNKEDRDIYRDLSDREKIEFIIKSCDKKMEEVCNEFELNPENTIYVNLVRSERGLFLYMEPMGFIGTNVTIFPNQKSSIKFLNESGKIFRFREGKSVLTREFNLEEENFISFLPWSN